MATPQQSPQQPIYPRDLNLALDRNFTKFTSYTDSRFESLAAQMRIGYEESLMRDNDLANNMRTLADTILRVAERVGNVETRVTNIETTLQEVRQEMKEMREQIKDGFAAQAERLNEVIVRVDKIERNGHS